MKRKMGKKPIIWRTASAGLCAAGSLLLILSIRASAYSAQHMNRQPEPSSVAETEPVKLRMGFAHEVLPLKDVGFHSSLLQFGNNKAVNILLIGQDAAADSGARSDTMILCTFNKKNNTVTLTSFLRDLYVKIPGHKSNRINAAYRFGGTKLLNETLRENFGIEVDGNIQVDFSCFEEIIDRLGGVTLELTAAEAEFVNSHLEGSALSEGSNLLTGAQALLYARNRYDVDGDFSRTNRQRKLLSVLMETYKCKTLPETLSLIQAMIPMITTDISKADLTAYAVSLLPMFSDAEIRKLAIPVPDGYYDAKIDGMAVLVPDIPKNVQALEDALT